MATFISELIKYCLTVFTRARSVPAPLAEISPATVESVRRLQRLLGSDSRLTIQDGNTGLEVLFNDVTTEMLTAWLDEVKATTAARVNNMDVRGIDPEKGHPQTWSGVAHLVQA